MNKDTAFLHIQESVFGSDYYYRRDGLSLDALKDLDEQQLEILKKRCLAELKSNDSRVMELAGELQIKEAIPILEKRMSGLRAWLDTKYLTTVVVALYKIDKDQSLKRNLLTAYKRSLLASSRRMLLYAMRYFVDKDVMDVYSSALEDKNPSIRATAARVILHACMKDYDIERPKSESPLVIDLLSSDEEKWKPASKKLQEVCSGYVSS